MANSDINPNKKRGYQMEISENPTEKEGIIYDIMELSKETPGRIKEMLEKSKNTIISLRDENEELRKREEKSTNIIVERDKTIKELKEHFGNLVFDLNKELGHCKTDLFEQKRATEYYREKYEEAIKEIEKLKKLS